MFDLFETVSRSNKTKLEDTANIKTALTALGYYDDTETGLSPYADEQLFQSVQYFQKDNDLKIDGVLNPKGPTEKKLKENLKKDTKAGNAFGDFKRNFDDMNTTNFKDGDKYFHCKANYEATKRGWAGELVATALSHAKEVKDKYWNGYNDGFDDHVANKVGKNTAKLKGYKSAKEACAIFRPKGLDEKY